MLCESITILRNQRISTSNILSLTQSMYDAIDMTFRQDSLAEIDRSAKADGWALTRLHFKYASRRVDMAAEGELAVVDLDAAVEHAEATMNENVIEARDGLRVRRDEDVVNVEKNGIFRAYGFSNDARG